MILIVESTFLKSNQLSIKQFIIFHFLLTATPYAMIKSIDTASIHRICSSQVVVDLATAVKELVENAIDAGATVIEISLTEFGESMIEVHDNARGIDPEDFEGLAMKHHTSKINQFEDLANVASYGFRGEALNSLCELSENFSVVTKRVEDNSAFKLNFDRLGRLSKQELTTRETGTTVVIEKLFSSLPVRRAEFVRNIKKQYQKMLRIIQAYAVFATGIKFVMINSTNGVRQTVLSTQQTSQIENNICSVFGSKFLNSLQKFSTNIYHNESENIGDEEEIVSETQLDRDRIGIVTGYISKIGLGIGRSDNDRQFIFCNGRPIDLLKMMKGVNEIWRKYEMKQKPAFIIDIRIKRDTVDVNLAPNKREVLIENEDLLIENVKGAIDKLYSVTRNTLQVNNSFSELRKLSSFANFVMPAAVTSVQKTSITTVKEVRPNPVEFDEGRSIEEEEDIVISDKGEAKKDAAISTQILEVQIPQHQPAEPIPVTNHAYEGTDVTWASPSEFNRLSQLSSILPIEEQSAEFIEEWTPSAYSETPWDVSTNMFMSKKRELESSASEPSALMEKNDSVRVKRRRQEALSLSSLSPIGNEQDTEVDKNVRIIEKHDFARMKILGQFNLGFIIVELDGDLYILDQHACDEKYRFEGLQRSTKLHHQPLLKPLVVEMTANLESVVEDYMDIFEANGFQLQVNDNEPVGRRVSMVSMPFSKGTQFGVNDVLELASMLCGEDGDDFYEGRMNKNYLSLRNDPVSQGMTRKSQNSSGSLSGPRILLPKIMTMFASRACRSAVMIGTALNKVEMKNIVQQMVSVEQPWNCPHGRPTMRHLFDIESFFAKEDNVNEFVIGNKGFFDDGCLRRLDNHLRDALEEDT